MRERIASLAQNALKAYSALLFIDDKRLGAVFLAISFLNPSVAISGLVALFFAILFAELIEFKEAYLLQGFYLYNSLLVGMGVGYIFAPSPLSFGLIAVGAAFTFMLSFMLNRLFSYYKIPILSLPFSIVTMFWYLASLKYSALASTLVNNATRFDIALPLALSGFFKSLGTIFFLPLNLAGVLIFVALLFSSRIVAVMAVVGYYFGVLVHSWLIGSLHQALVDPFAFNYILVAISLCGVFLLPNPKNFLLSLVGVAISVVLTDSIAILFNYYAIPVFTLPFNITVIVFIFILSLNFYRSFNIDIRETPEASLSNYLAKIFRFGSTPIQIALPFSGEWSVYQAFDDEWTHKGNYKYAYDFIKLKEGKSYKNEGNFLEDYYAFGESVLSPVGGYVVALRDDLADNPVGAVDRVNNWGNYIVIKSDLGYYVEISHLMQYSLAVKVGEYVQASQVIAKCGNSGYSPQPHIHIQVQSVASVGGYTQEFCFSEYLKDGELFLHSLPKKGEIVKGVVANRMIASRMHLILDDRFVYEVFVDGVKQKETTFVVKMDGASRYFLEDEALNRLFFFADSKQFYFYDYQGEESHLKALFRIAPRIPFVLGAFRFKEALPIYLLQKRLGQIATELLATIAPQVYKKEFYYRFEHMCIESHFGRACLSDANKALTLIEYDSVILKRKE